jgi:branched-chain amino acid transport system permease protein
MDYLIQQIADGISTGLVYALIALAMVIIHQSSGVLNFGQGEMATLAAFISWQFNAWGAPIVLAIALAMLLSFLLGACVERAVVSRFASADHFTHLLVMLGLFMTTNAITGLVWGYTVRSFPDPLPRGSIDLLGGAIAIRTLGVVVIVVLVCVALIVLFRKTTMGLAMRASISNPESARLSGIDVGRMHTLGWALAAGLGALAGCLAASKLFLEPNMMLSVLIYSFAAVIVGGLNSPLGAVVGGIIIGVAENLAGAYLREVVGNDLKVSVPLLIVIAILLVRPQGIFGGRKIARV